MENKKIHNGLWYLFRLSLFFFVSIWLIVAVLYTIQTENAEKQVLQAEKQSKAFLVNQAAKAFIQAKKQDKFSGIILAQETRTKIKAESQAMRIAESRAQAQYDALNKTQTTRINSDEQIMKYFSAWDGSHRGLTRFIKKTMNDPGSYKHIDTLVVDKGSYLIVKTTYRGKNGFGAIVKGFISAMVDLNGNVIQILAQG